MNVTSRFRYAYKDIAETEITTTFSPMIASIIKKYDTSINQADTAIISINGGSGNFIYTWKLTNSIGIVLQSNYQNSIPEFNFKCSESGNMNLECMITDVVSNTSIVVNKSITVMNLVSTICASDFEYTEINSTILATPANAAKASVSVSNGSGNYTYSWSISNCAIVSAYDESSIMYWSSNVGDVVLKCVIKDNNTGYTIQVSKTVKCYPKLTATITTDAPSYPFAFSVGGSNYSTYCTANVIISGGSGNYTVVNWCVSDYYTDKGLQASVTPYFLTKYIFPTTTRGKLVIRCIVSDKITAQALYIYHFINVI